MFTYEFKLSMNLLSGGGGNFPKKKKGFGKKAGPIMPRQTYQGTF